MISREGLLLLPFFFEFILKGGDFMSQGRNVELMEVLHDMPETFPYSNEIRRTVELLLNARRVEDLDDYSDADFNRFTLQLSDANRAAENESRIAFSYLERVEPLPIMRRFF